ncbi:hypothetical protein [Cobetia sp.]|jgi:hypothetical protein|uniref:DUF6932 family protein n=1 Tax=Cobetia sp. TaxID=1873876 RepID=UPI00257E242A|nr:hypothetical protein [Cobetia sp.]|tara:strand:+ start:237 stop:842 length:606 start_codon:yes stop_codon:yes gene_type:complete
MNIPAWNAEGLMPPVVEASSPNVQSSRLPYKVDITDLCEYFSTSPKRIEILNKLLDYRKLIHDTGLTTGMQWINGSFTENVEVREERSPNDIDVVNYVKIPPEIAKDESKAGAILYPLAIKPENKTAIKTNYLVDAYSICYGYQALNYEYIEVAAYWYSMWSHTRDGIWKGFLAIDLAPHLDSQARQILQNKLNPVEDTNA